MTEPPTLSLDDTMLTASVRLPERLIAIIDTIAGKHLRTRSDIIRTLLVAKLADTGHVSIDHDNFRL